MYNTINENYGQVVQIYNTEISKAVNTAVQLKIYQMMKIEREEF